MIGSRRGGEAHADSITIICRRSRGRRLRRWRGHPREADTDLWSGRRDDDLVADAHESRTPVSEPTTREIATGMTRSPVLKGE